MPSPERLSPSGLVFLNSHLGIAKANGLSLVAHLRYYYKLLGRMARSSLRFVVPAYARALQLWIFFLRH